MLKEKKHSGFTILELFIALAVFSLVFLVVAPSAHNIIKRHRLIAEMNKTSSFIRYARYSAISLANTVTICPSSNFIHCQKSWKDGLIVFIDSNYNKQLDHTERLLASESFFSRFHKIKGANRPIVFYENGTNSTPATIIICPQSNESIYAKAVVVSLQGRVRLSIDSNKDGIDETSGNNNIDCQAI